MFEKISDVLIHLVIGWNFFFKKVSINLRTQFCLLLS